MDGMERTEPLRSSFGYLVRIKRDFVSCKAILWDIEYAKKKTLWYTLALFSVTSIFSELKKWNRYTFDIWRQRGRKFQCRNKNRLNVRERKRQIRVILRFIIRVRYIELRSNSDCHRIPMSGWLGMDFRAFLSRLARAVFIPSRPSIRSSVRPSVRPSVRTYIRRPLLIPGFVRPSS